MKIKKTSLPFIIIFLYFLLERVTFTLLGGTFRVYFFMTHVCAFVACQYYGTTLGDLLVKAVPVLLPFCVFVFGYSLLLGLPI